MFRRLNPSSKGPRPVKVSMFAGVPPFIEILPLKQQERILSIKAGWQKLPKALRVVASLLFSVGVGFMLSLTTAPWNFALIFGGSLGLIFCVSYFMYRRLAGTLGRFTTLALFALMWGILFFVLALLTPRCIDYATFTATTCSPTEALGVMLPGLLIPITVAVLVFPFRFVVKKFYQVSYLYFRFIMGFKKR